MTAYPIFSQEGGQQIAINPDSVTSIIELSQNACLSVFPTAAQPISQCLLKALSLASPAHLTWARTRPDANPTEVGPKELVGIRIVLMVVQETGDPRLQ